MREGVAKKLYALAIVVPAMFLVAYLWLSRELIVEYGVTEPFSSGFILFVLLMTVPVFLLALFLKRIPRAMIIYAIICTVYAATFLAFPAKFGVP